MFSLKKKNGIYSTKINDLAITAINLRKENRIIIFKIFDYVYNY